MRKDHALLPSPAPSAASSSASLAAGAGFEDPKPLEPSPAENAAHNRQACRAIFGCRMQAQVQLPCYVAMQLRGQCSTVNEQVLSCTPGHLADSASKLPTSKATAAQIAAKDGLGAVRGGGAFLLQDSSHMVLSIGT